MIERPWGRVVGTIIMVLCVSCDIICLSCDVSFVFFLYTLFWWQICNGLTLWNVGIIYQFIHYSVHSLFCSSTHRHVQCTCPSIIHSSPIHISIHLYTHISIYPLTHLPINLFIDSFIYLFVLLTVIVQGSISNPDNKDCLNRTGTTTKSNGIRKGK